MPATERSKDLMYIRAIFTGFLFYVVALPSWGNQDSGLKLSGDDAFTERTATIEVKGAFWDVGAPRTLYCRFPIRQWTRDKVATKQEIPANEFDGTAIVKVGKEKTVLKQGKFTHELETLSASSRGVHAVEVNWVTVRTFQYNAKEGHALWSDSGSTTITTFIGNCAAFEE